MELLLVWPVAVLIVCTLSVVVHEAGHSIAGTAAGLKIEEVHIGSGRILGTFSLWGTAIIWHLNPLGGGRSVQGALSRKNTRRYKLRQALFILGGPLASAALAAAFYMVWKALLHNHLPGSPISAMEAHLIRVTSVSTMFVAVAFVVNFLPISWRADGLVLRSDGMLLLDLYQLTRSEIISRYHLARSRHYLYPDSLDYVKALRHLDRANRRKKLEDSFSELAQIAYVISPDVDPKQFHQVWDVLENIAVSADDKCRAADGRATMVVYNPEATRKDKEIALEGLNRALKLDTRPEISLPLRATRAGLYTELGMNAEALPELEHCRAACTARLDCAYCTLYLARLCAQNGDVKRAKCLMEEYLSIPLAANEVAQAGVMGILQRLQNETYDAIAIHADARKAALSSGV